MKPFVKFSLIVLIGLLSALPVQASPYLTGSGDVNGDGAINIQDVQLVAHAFGWTPATLGWNPAYDLDGNQIIEVFDIVLISNQWSPWWFENFDDGVADGFEEIQLWYCQGVSCSSYNVNNGWYTIYGPNDMGSAPGALVGDNSWQFYSVEADLNMGYVDGTAAGLLAYVQTDASYYTHIHFSLIARNDVWWLGVRHEWIDPDPLIASGTMQINPDQTYHLKLSITPNGIVHAYLDGVLVGEGPLPSNAPTSGKAGVVAGEVVANWDNFVVHGN